MRGETAHEWGTQGWTVGKMCGNGERGSAMHPSQNRDMEYPVL